MKGNCGKGLKGPDFESGFEVLLSLPCMDLWVR